MVDLLAQLSIHLGFLFAVGTVIVRAARRKDVAFVIMNILALLLFEAAHDLTDRASGRFASWVFSFQLLCVLFTTTAVNRYLLSFAGLLILDRDGSKYKKTPGVVVVYVTALFLSYTYTFESLGLRDTTSNGAITHKISDALYFVTMTITTVGYGDLVPATQLGRMFAALAALNGYLIFAVLVSTLVPRILERAGAQIEKAALEKPPDV